MSIISHRLAVNITENSGRKERMTMSTTWTIAVDWDRNGNFTGMDDDISDHVIEA